LTLYNFFQIEEALDLGWETHAKVYLSWAEAKFGQRQGRALFTLRMSPGCSLNEIIDAVWDADDPLDDEQGSARVLLHDLKKKLIPMGYTVLYTRQVDGPGTYTIEHMETENV
jgi:hypothetical protein